ncbi:hypothetical protein RCL1_005630 [Eukaryota sp. TZLM3-RCL]
MSRERHHSDRGPPTKRARTEGPEPALSLIVKRLAAIDLRQDFDRQCHADASFIVNILKSGDPSLNEVVTTFVECTRAYPWKSPLYARLLYYMSVLHEPGPTFFTSLMEHFMAELSSSLHNKGPGLAAFPSFLRFIFCLSSESIIPLSSLSLFLTTLSTTILSPSVLLPYRSWLLESILSVLPWAVRLVFSLRNDPQILSSFSSFLSLFIPSQLNPEIPPLLESVSLESASTRPLNNDLSPSLNSVLSVQVATLFERFDDLEYVPTVPLFIFPLSPLDFTEVQLPTIDNQIEKIEIMIGDIDVVVDSVSSFIVAYPDPNHVITFLSRLIDESMIAWKDQPFKITSILREIELIVPPRSVEVSDLHRSIILTCFANLFSLKSIRKLHTLHYFFVLTDLSRNTNNFPRFLGPAISYFIKNAVNLSPYAFKTFYLWFSHHLSNFGWFFPWEKMNNILELPPLDPVKILLTNVIDQCVALIFRERIADSLPLQWHALLPVDIPPLAEVGSDASSRGFTNPCADSSYIYHSEYTNCFDLLIQRKDPNEWIDLTKSLPPIHRLLIHLYSLLVAGTVSISFSANYFIAYSNLFNSEIVVNDFYKVFITIGALDYWKVRPQRAVITLQLLVKLNVISLSNLIEVILPIKNLIELKTEEGSLFAPLVSYQLLFPKSLQETSMLLQLWELLTTLFGLENEDSCYTNLMLLAAGVDHALSLASTVIEEREVREDEEFGREAKESLENGSLQWWKVTTCHNFGNLVQNFGGEHASSIIASLKNSQEILNVLNK